MLKVFRKLFGKKINITQSQFNGGVKVCKDCGTSTNSSLPHCVNCGGCEFYNTYNDYLLTTYKYCAKCGHDNTAGNKCCPYCGCSRFISYSSLIAKQHAEATKDDRKKKLKIVAIVLGILLVLGLLIFAIYEHIVIKDTSWPGLLIMFLVYSIVTFGSLLIFKVIDPADYDYFAIGYTVVNGLIYLAGFVLSLLFIIFPYDYGQRWEWAIIWSFGISLTMLINSIAVLIAFIRLGIHIEVEGLVGAPVAFILFSLIVLVASIVCITKDFGWATYF